ncbi:MAG: T9SS type A sorting domain-containing protein [Salinivirgaceae bacterium]|nr:T9SS type A sorting domain-containing protein [Salinivirgaceae bacterium]
MSKKYLILMLLISCFVINTNATVLEKKGHLLMAQNQLIGFTENKGQITDENGNSIPDVLYSCSIKNMDIFITSTGLSYVFSENGEEINNRILNGRELKDGKILNSKINYHRTNMILDGASIQKKNIITSKESSTTKSVFYNASNLDGIKNIKTFKEITIANIYPGIDWVLYIEEASEFAMKYDFVVHPGASPEAIKMVYDGAQINLNNEETMLSIETSLGSIKEGTLLSYQGIKKNIISSKYELQNNTIAFNIENYNTKQTLTIDPPVVIWSTNYGGSETEYFNDMVVDDEDNLYIYGLTRSTNLPGLTGSGSYMGSFDTFIVKFDAIGKLLWSTIFGGIDNDDNDGGIAINNSTNEIYICGATKSTDFPIKSLDGAYNHATIEGGNNGFITKVNADGELLWSTFIGGAEWDYLSDIEVDANNELFILGLTSSTDFPVVNLEGAYNEASFHGGMNDGILMKFDENDQLAWSTFFGGNDTDQLPMLKFDNNNHLMLVGYSSSSDFPMVAKTGAYNNPTYTSGDYNQAVILEFDENRSLIWSTFYGGTRADDARSMGWDAENNFYVVGATESGDMNTVELAGAFNCAEINNELIPYVSDAFILRFDENKALNWATYYGGDDGDLATGISFDNQGNMWLCGATSSQNFQIKELEGAFNQTSFAAGVRVMFWSRFDKNKNIDWSTVYGGDDFGWGYGFAKRSDNRLLLITQAKTDAGLSTGLVAENPLSYNQGNLESNDIVILEFTTGSSVGVEENIIDNNLGVYPNPLSSNNLNVNSESVMTNVKLINVAGQIVKNINCNKNKIEINTDNLINGMYFIQVQTSNRTINKKVQILR